MGLKIGPIITSNPGANLYPIVLNYHHLLSKNRLKLTQSRVRLVKECEISFVHPILARERLADLLGRLKSFSIVLSVLRAIFFHKVPHLSIL